MIIIFTWDEIIIRIGTRIIERFPASCNVRTELNKQRALNEVVKTFPTSGERMPYFPRQFPSGIFNITDIEYTDDPEYAPVKIKTDAVREVQTWFLSKGGDYENVTGRTQLDFGYWMHYTKSKTTLGCIRFDNPEDTLKVAGIIDGYLKMNSPVKLEVL